MRYLTQTLALSALSWLLGSVPATADTYVGFLYNGSNYTTLAVPGATFTEATGVSGSDVVGYCGTSSGTYYGFLYNGTSYTTLAPTGATRSLATGVSSGNVVGGYTDSNGNNHGFLYNGTTYTTLAPLEPRYPGQTASLVRVSANSG